MTSSERCRDSKEVTRFGANHREKSIAQWVKLLLLCSWQGLVVNEYSGTAVIFILVRCKNQHLWLSLTFQQATYSLIRLSLVAAMVLLRALDPSGPSGVTLVTVPVPTNQCTDATSVTLLFPALLHIQSTLRGWPGKGWPFTFVMGKCCINGRQISLLNTH